MSLIPLTFHIAYFSDLHGPWRDINTLCLASCRRYTGATRIIVHYNCEGSGADWDNARSLPAVEWQQTDFPTWPHTADPQLKLDLFRLTTLWEAGGFFSDPDFIFLKSFETFRDTPAVIGTQCKQKQKLACGLIGCVPGSLFIETYLRLFRERLANKSALMAIPWQISTAYPVRVLNRPAFYPVAWSNKTFWSGGKTCLKNAYALHLWATLKPELTVALLRQTDLRSWIEEVLDDRPQMAAQWLPGMLLCFD